MMKTKLTSLIYGTLVAGSLVLSVGPALARDWAKRDGRDYHRPVPPVPAPVYPAGRIPQRVWRYPAAPAYPPATIYGDPAYGYPVAAPAYSQDLYRQLENARRKKAYDATHHASREQLAKDNARIVRLESQLGVR
jgi:hypothetical protein